MEKKIEFPKPFDKPINKSWNGLNGVPHYMTPNGMLLPREMQPPPMYGKRGSTIPSKFIPRFNLNRNYNNSYQKYKRESENVSCITCDIQFKSLQELNKHENEHQACGIEGCRFVGNPQAIAKHINMQHNSGLFDKLKNISTPEDIEKWRNDRKRKYPTQGNIELRQKIQEEKLQRGERLSEPNFRFGRKEDRSSCRGRRTEKRGGRIDFNRDTRKRNFPRSTTDQNNESKPQINNKLSEIYKNIEFVIEDIDEFNENLPRFKGTGTMIDYIKCKSSGLIDNPLANLLGMYGSDDSNEDSEEEMFVPSKNDPDEIMKDKISTIISEMKSNDSNIEPTRESDLSSGEEPEIILIAKEDDGEPLLADSKVTRNSVSKSDNYNKRRRFKRKNRNDKNSSEISERKIQPKKLLNYTKLKTQRSNTLLSKLLESDIRHERNVLLQCVRHVVKNDFFKIAN